MNVRMLLLLMMMWVTTLFVGCELTTVVEKSKKQQKTTSAKSSAASKSKTTPVKIGAQKAQPGPQLDKKTAEFIDVSQQIGSILKTVKDVPTAKAAKTKIAKLSGRWSELGNQLMGEKSTLPSEKKFENSAASMEAMTTIRSELFRIKTKLPDDAAAQLDDFSNMVLGR